VVACLDAEPVMTTLFLSCARGDDEPFVRRLYHDLTGGGFEVWFDRFKVRSQRVTLHHE
jgi:hypothetical protein